MVSLYIVIISCLFILKKIFKKPNLKDVAMNDRSAIPYLVHEAFRILATQYYLALRLFSDVRFRAPILIIWVATFGGSLHDAVTTFFMLKLGADEVVVGRITAMMSVGGLILSPLYGYWMDKRGVFFPLLLSSLCCSIGCLIRGTANSLNQLYIGAAVLGCGAGGLFTLVLSHICTHSPPSDRSAVVSAYLFQTNALRLLGKGMFPITNGILVKIFGYVSDDLSTYRLHMATCTGFCFFGVAWLIKDGKELYQHSLKTSSQQNLTTEIKKISNHVKTTAAATNATTTTPSLSSPSSSLPPSSPSPSSTPSTPSSWLLFSLLSFVGAIQSFGYQTLIILWPFYVRDAFQFGSNEYAWFIFIGAIVCTFTVASLPVVEQSIGYVKTTLYTTLLPSLSFIGFLSIWGGNISSTGSTSIVNAKTRTMSTIGGISVHVLIVVISLGSLRLSQASIKSMAPSHISKSEQGKAFGFLATVIKFGEILSGLIAPMIYKDSGSSVFPVFIMGCILVIASILLWFIGKNQKRRFSTVEMTKEEILAIEREER
jgi:MFS family permease